MSRGLVVGHFLSSVWDISDIKLMFSAYLKTVYFHIWAKYNGFTDDDNDKD